MFKVGMIMCGALTLAMMDNVIAAPSGENVPSKQAAMNRKNEKAKDLNRKSERDEKSKAREESGGDSGHSLTQEDEAS